MKTPRIAPKRTIVQTLLTIIYLVFPLLTLNGNPFFRIDIIKHTLFMAGAAIRIDQFYLVLFVTLLFVIMFLLLTVMVGRVWCGWMCPQTLLNEMQEAGERKLRKLFPAALAGLARQLAALSISIVFAAATILWFISPHEFMFRLAAFTDYPVTVTCFLATALLLHLNLVVVGRSFCKSYCPYGRFQVALQDSATLNLVFVEETRDACIKCSACVRACPMGIDVRRGFQIECINCGRCIDACRSVMQNCSIPQGLIAYRFGDQLGGRPRFGIRSLVLTALSLLLITGVIQGVAGRSDTAFVLQRNPTASVRKLPDGVQIQAWKAIVGNRGEQSARFTLENLHGAEGTVVLLGPVRDLQIDANENRTVDFFLSFPATRQAGLPLEITLLRDGKPVASSSLTP